MTLLAIHNALYMLALSVASGFIGGYLLRLGFPLPWVFLIYGTFFLLRFGLRLLVMGTVRRLGFRRTIMLGTAVIALQYWPLAHAGQLRYLIAWLICMSVGEALYWPNYHAAVAVAGTVEARGAQLGLRAALTCVASVLGPLTGGIVLSVLGPGADFALGAVIMVLAVLPLLAAPEFAAGTVPRLRDSFRGLDPLAMLLFLNDGWMSAGWLSIWSMLYFNLLGARYDAFGIANAAAGLVGFVVSLAAGRWIDRRRHDGRQLALVSLALLVSVALRVASGWWPAAGAVANLTGIAVNGAYAPLLMSALYDRAKRSDGAFRFHMAIEGAWDLGGLAGHFVGALIAWCLPRDATFSVLPAGLGVVIFAICMRRDRAHHHLVREAGTA